LTLIDGGYSERNIDNMEVFVICAIFIGLTWICAAPKSPSRPSKETLNEACPNEGTGDFAYTPDSEIHSQNELKF